MFKYRLQLLYQPAPAIVPQVPVPLQQASAYVTQAPLAPAHMNNGEINDNPNLIPSHSECDVYISQNLKEKNWNREYMTWRCYFIKIL